MNRTKLKNYAPQARRDFIQAMTDRAAYFGLTATKIEPVVEKGDVAVIGGRSFPRAVAKKRKALEDRIKKQGFGPTMEAMAYTWFNRLVAIRFMELYGYLDHGYRVLSHPEVKPTPEILEHAEHVDLPGLKKEAVIDLKLAGNKESELYRLLLTAQCNALHSAMPFLFEKIDDETELLLPDNLLHSDSLIRKLVNEIDEEDWQEVEIIGWLYQFYISERKDEVIGKVVASEDIPAATQLFTPNWIVKYLVQNTLGRQWLATYPQSALRQQMEYYIEPAEQTPEVQEQLKAITPTSLNPEELTLLDPACGSGHILVEAYDLFKAIYQERGYRAKDIPALILQRNLFGLEIDDRAAQLAAFALMMKARLDDRRIFDSEAKPNVVAIQDSKGLNAEDITHALNSPINKEDVPKEYLFDEIQDEKTPLFSKKVLADKGHVSQADIASLVELFENAKTFGSLIQVPPKLAAKLPEIEKRAHDVLKFGDLTHASAHALKPLLQQARLLAKQYEVVVANPPYMGSKYYTPMLKTFINKEFKEAKADLYACFMERNRFATKTSSFHGMINIPNWMFLSSFEDMRKSLFETQTIDTFVHNGRGVFGSDFGSCAFVIRKAHLPEYRGSYRRLFEKQGSVASNEELEARFHTATTYTPSNADFAKIPGSPVAYWVSDVTRNLFTTQPLLDALAKPRAGMQTANNERFLRHWYEVRFGLIGFGQPSRQAISSTEYTWFPYNKGGEYRRWYGNNLFVLNWTNDGNNLYTETSNPVIRNPEYHLKEGVTWTTTSISFFGVRHSPIGFFFDMKGCCCFIATDKLRGLLGFLASKPATWVLDLLNPSTENQVGDLARLPVIASMLNQHGVVAAVDEAISIARTDWDSWETSWDFQTPPVLQHKAASLRDSQETADAECLARFARMKELETENNRLFIEAYGLQDELSSEVPDDQITLYRPDRQEDIKRLLSYAVGCMMGRYSLDKPGLILANQGDSIEEYLQRTSTSFAPVTSERIVREHGSVVFAPGARPHCFSCGAECDLTDAQFVIAAYDESEPLRGRPLIYCVKCCEEKQTGGGSFRQPLAQFSVSQALKRNWCELSTLQAFLELAGCFVHRIPRRRDEVAFLPDDDGIIPLLETDWGIREDATNRFVEFLGAAWPKEHLDENLKFVADSLGTTSSEQPRETIRRYLATGFYKHHLSMYKKRPIYWLFSSGKQRAFQCLVYLHRYHEGTLARMRTEYVIPLQGQIAARIEQLEGDKAKATSTSHRKKLQKEQDDLKKQEIELRTFEEKLKHAADQRISLDLDDGVKVNYAKFGDLLAESKAITGGKDED